MPIPVYQVLHVAGVIFLTAITFQACAARDQDKRKQHMMLGGIASLIALVAGFGLLSKLNLPFSGWVIVKLVCWLAISALAGAAYRSPGKAGLFCKLTAALVLVALYCVYYRPF